MRLGRIPRNRLSSIIRDLVDMGLLEKTREGYYSVPDPIVRHAILHKVRV
ncbi:MAG: hypothetical protein GSR85_06535 [Desulfurococcales archaeon]|nr:hypothetical protein [Desulfurococcales archaeon]